MDQTHEDAYSELLSAVENHKLGLELVGDQKKEISRIKKMLPYEYKKFNNSVVPLFREVGMSMDGWDRGESQLTPQQIAVINKFTQMERDMQQSIDRQVFDVLLPFQQEILVKHFLGREIRNAGLFDCLLYGTVGSRLLTDVQHVDLIRRSKDEFLSDIKVEVSEVLEKSIDMNIGKIVEILEKEPASQREIAPLFQKLRPADLSSPSGLRAVLGHFHLRKGKGKEHNDSKKAVYHWKLTMQCLGELANDFSSQQLVALEEWIAEHRDSLLGEKQEESLSKLDMIVSPQQKENLLRLLGRKETEFYGIFGAVTKGVGLGRFLSDGQRKNIAKIGRLIVDQTLDETRQIIQDSHEKYSTRIIRELSPEVASRLREELAGMEFQARHLTTRWTKVVVRIEK